MNKKDKKYIESLAGDISRKMPDYDGDGFPDLFDCDPFDPTKDGLIGDAWKRMTAAAQTARRRIFRPAAVSGREAVRHVYTRAYGAGAAARRAAETRIRRVKEFVRAPSAERIRRIEAGKEAFLRKRELPKPTAPITVSAQDIAKKIHEETARVARVARGFEKQVDPYARDVERALGFHRKEIPKEIRWLGEQAKGVGYGVAFRAPAAGVEMAGMLPGAAVTIARKPEILPAAATVGMYMMGQSMFRGFTTEPGATIGELVGLHALTKGAKVSEVVKAKVKVPAIMEAVKVPEMPKVRALKAKVKMPAIVEDIKIPEMPKFPGTPKFRALEGKFPTPKGLTPEKAIKFEAGMEVTRRLKYAGSPIERPLDFNVVKALKGRGEIVEKWIETHPKQKTVIAGSGAAWAQFKSARTPGDIDLYVADPLLAGKQMHISMVKELGAGNVRITPTDHPTFGKSSLIETKTGTRWSHAIDLHELPQVGGVMELGLMTQKPVMIAGKRYVSAGELMQRKAASVLYPREPGTIGPKPHRAKDIADYLQETTQLAEKEFATAETAWFLRGRQIKTATETQRLITEYEVHSGLYTAPASRAYAALPQYVKHPSYLIATYTAGARDYPVAKYPYAQKYPVAKYPGAAKYPPTRYPVARKYPPTKYPPGYEPYKPPYTPPYELYTPPYELYTPPYEPYTPPYEPYTPPYEPYTPPYEPYTPPYEPYTPPPDGRKPPPIRIPKKKRKKVKPRKAKPAMAAGWKQRHELIMLEDFLGYKI